MSLNAGDYFQKIANSIEEVIWLSDKSGAMLYLSPYWSKLTGMSDSDVIGNAWLTCIAKDDQAELSRLLEGADQGEQFSLTVKLQSASEKKNLLISGYKIRTKAGDFDGFSGTMKLLMSDGDIAELNNQLAEYRLKLQLMEAQLTDKTEFIDKVFDASEDVIAVLDSDLRFLNINKKCERMYKRKKEELIGKVYTEEFPATVNSKAHKDILRALQGEVIHNPIAVSSVIKGYFENYFIPLKRNEEIHGVLIVSHEVTEIMEASEQVRITNDELIRTNKELEQFAYVSSHDLQEPLRKIQTFSDLVIRKLDISKEDVLKYLGRINSSAARMSALIEDLLNFSRINHGDQRKVRVDLNEVLASVMNDFELMINQKQAKVEVQTLPVIGAIPIQMTQLFSNLLSNSLKFNTGIPEIRIELHNNPRELDEVLPMRDKELNYFKLTFKDNGIGFDPEYSEQIFTIFQRLHPRHEFEGTGIGLALCAKIIENHQGRIMARSEKGKGSVFEIYLPF